MRVSFWSLAQVCVAAGLLVGSQFARAEEPSETAGVTRVSKARKTPSPVQTTAFANSIEAPQPVSGGIDVASEPYATSMEPGDGYYHGMLHRAAHRHDDDIEIDVLDDGCKCKECRKARKAAKKMIREEEKMCREEESRCRRHCPHGHGYGQCPYGCNSCHPMFSYFGGKFGCLMPTGNGGYGTPWFGKYARVYPQDVNHFDQRDGQLYSAQGYGVPMAVPLAPTVGHTYNYGWGVPSSRLTPISHPTR